MIQLSKDCLPAQVTKVRVTALVGNTYHARVHLSGGKEAGAREIDIDARPSDAINLAVRFNAPMYVAKQVWGRLSEGHCSHRMAVSECMGSRGC